MKDRFSEIAGSYAAFRPTYPPELYEFIFSHVKHFDQAWDAGTGNGQVASFLSGKFKKVFATDISAKQIANAPASPNVIYSVAGEDTALAPGSVDLITAAQAIHWFDRRKFYDEARRVGRRDSMIAVWGYGLLNVDDQIDPLILDFYTRRVGPYWDAERKLIDDHYSTLEFPFNEIEAPEFSINVKWEYEELIGYLNTWSSVGNYTKANGSNPVDNLSKEMLPQWKNEKRNVSFPVFLRLGIL